MSSVTLYWIILAKYNITFKLKETDKRNMKDILINHNEQGWLRITNDDFSKNLGFTFQDVQGMTWLLSSEIWWRHLKKRE